jgi:AmiR/NasT family two-component response regulator
VAHEFDGLDGHPLHADIAAELERLTVYGDAQKLKVSQLQAALDSRVVIEQAIGMLAERFNLPFADAFELLRAGARSTRQKVRAIAEELRDSRQTPPEIMDLLSGGAASLLSMSTAELLRCPQCGTPFPN